VTDPAKTSLVELAATFVRLGLTAFGGPAAHIGLMRESFVRRLGWLDDATFLDLVGLSNLIPGPTSTELAMHIGHRRAGWPGFIVAGLGFIAPAVGLVLALAWVYVSFGTRPEVASVLAGIAPVVIAIVANAAVGLGRTALPTASLAAVAGAVVAGSLVGVSEIGLLLGGGLLTLLAAEVRGRAAAVRRGESSAVREGRPDRGAGSDGHGAFGIGWLGSGKALALAGVAAAVGPLAILLEFLKIGAVIFGSGYVLVALLRTELVTDLHWITDSQLLDAVAVGQLTPGPVFSTGTFIGYLVGGPPGALAATVGIFLPAFLFVALSVVLLARLQASLRVRAFLDGVNAAAVALIAVVAGGLVATVRDDPPSIGVATVALVVLLQGRVGPGWLMLAGATIGLVRLALG
jgi:chromate transporter